LDSVPLCWFLPFKWEFEMKPDLEKEAARIADAIVELVERTDGPVTLARVQKEISGFAKHEPPSWRHQRRHWRTGRVISFWCEMTEAGFRAFQKVINERRVAIQFVNELPYFMDDCLIDADDWQPIVLLPSRAANVDSQNWHLRVPQEVYDQLAKRVAERKSRVRPLKLRYAGCTADRFFDVTPMQQ
jgi:hypothetical protein